jgi:hypothetical protein
MLKILVSFALGPMWLKVLYFYLEHDAIINSIVFIYGVFLVVAHLNYKKISESIYLQIPATTGSKNLKKKIIEINIPKAIEEKKMFPFVAGQVSLFPKKITTEAIKNYLLREKRWMICCTKKRLAFFASRFFIICLTVLFSHDFTDFADYLLNQFCFPNAGNERNCAKNRFVGLYCHLGITDNNVIGCYSAREFVVAAAINMDIIQFLFFKILTQFICGVHSHGNT